MTPLEMAAMCNEVEIPDDYENGVDMFRDFKAVFLGTAHEIQGKRVLTMIFRWGGLWSPVVVSGTETTNMDSYATHVRMGAADVCRQIMMALIVEPVIQKEEEDEDYGD